MVQTQGTKGKKPPKFQHLPTIRAKKLKKIWVESHKIRSKWKALKRREGLVGGIQDDSERKDSEDGDGMSQHSEAMVEDSNPAEEQPLQMTRTQPSRHKPHAKTNSTTSQRPIVSRHKSSEAAVVSTTSSAQNSLRDLAREAYSPSSLHTYKSDPLHRRRQFGGRGEGSQMGRETTGSKRRGQPNMKLRMDVILEKIKRDFT